MTKPELEHQFNEYKEQVSQLEAKMTEGARLREQLLGKMELLKEMYQKLEQEEAKSAIPDSPEVPPSSFSEPDGSAQPEMEQNAPTG